MAEDKSTLDKRLTWNDGDLEITGPDGKPVDLKKIKQEGTAQVDGPTLHIFLPEADDGEE